MRRIVLIIRGEATPNLLPLTYYFLLSKNPECILVKSEK